MFRKTLAVLGITMLCLTSVAFTQDAATQEEIDKLKEEINDLEKRVMKNERKTALDKINFSGDFRFELNSINSTYDDYFDGMQLQRMLVDTLFYLGATGMPPQSPDAVQGFIAENYANYLYYLDNVVTFDWLKDVMGSFPPEMQQALLGQLLPYTLTEGYDYDNDILYTNRLRLQMDAKVSDSVDFSGRLSMYKVWGDSTGVQIFNGSPTSINIDGTTASVPNSDILRVERAYFTWRGPKFYLSIGRRPSTGGVPLNFRNDEPRGGSPLGTLVNFQFDGATFGWHISDTSTFRICYGVGFESGWGNAENLKQPADRIKDASFLGLNWDIVNTEDLFIQTTIMRAFDVTDGFAGLVVLPVDPVTGQDVPAPVVLRYTPSATLGDISWASLVAVAHPGAFDVFASLSYMESDPTDVTTPFGGLFSDPFQTPEKQDGYMYYLGARYNFANNKTKIGLEYNQGSEYWFNFTPAQDDIIAPKTNTRGSVWEGYVTHRIARRFIAKLGFQSYDYDYSGSGW
ncbi:MAG: DUF3373 family protein, partial [Acidobacteriota bacterium]|nr:DUF3373 family protein [Acidobacteriota bacterium]